ncbi:hypothetical protein SDC9_143724 [bioreactor metagenome]|uniref:Uncharacterized protein n=1 Tax=bioreactor metagenome TaxID=1076179 RepID=A0A645E469_9ZZZZ
MQLDQIQAIHVQALQAILCILNDCLACIAGSNVRVDLPAALGRDKYLPLLAFDEAADALFAFTAVIDVSRVKEVDALLKSSLHGGLRDLVTVLITPFAAQLPGAQRDFRDLNARIAKCPVLHTLSFLSAARRTGNVPVIYVRERLSLFLYSESSF